MYFKNFNQSFIMLKIIVIINKFKRFGIDFILLCCEFLSFCLSENDI